MIQQYIRQFLVDKNCSYPFSAEGKGTFNNSGSGAIEPKTYYILGISGGQDSMNLSFLFDLVEKQYEFKTIGIYSSHLWQTDEICLLSQLAAFSHVKKMPFFFPVPFKSVETEKKARVWRYTTFERICFLTKTQKIVTGHSSTDQIETFFFNLIRGSGTSGLTSLTQKKTSHWLKYRCFNEKRIRPNFAKQKTLKKEALSFRTSFPDLNLVAKKHPIEILRPLLNFNRYELNKFCSFFSLPIWTDETNFDLNYTRSRLRYKLLPTFRYFLNPNVDGTILRCLTTINEQNLYFETLLLQIFNYSLIPTQINFSDQKQSQFNWIIHNKDLMTQLPLSIKKKLVIMSLDHLKETQNRSNQIQLILGLCLLSQSMNLNPNQSKIEKFLLSKRLGILFTTDWIVLFTYLPE